MAWNISACTGEDPPHDIAALVANEQLSHFPGTIGPRNPRKMSEAILADAGVDAASDGGRLDGGALENESDAGLLLDDDASTAQGEGRFRPEGGDDELPEFFAAGRGCLNEDTRLTWAPDKRSLRIEFDRLIAEVIPGEVALRTTNFCNLMLPVESGRHTYAIKSIKTTIESDFPGDVNARVDLLPSYSGIGWKVENGDSPAIPGPNKGRTTIVSNFDDRLVFVRCYPAKPQLTLSAMAQLTSLPPYMAAGTMQILSVDVELVRRECTAQ
jgi:hypothetical protein